MALHGARRSGLTGLPLTRRSALAAGAAGLAALRTSSALGQQADGTPDASGAASTPGVGEEIHREATMPDWRFTVVAIRDPYQPADANAQQIPAGMRMVAYQVILTNNSVESMEFGISDVRLRDIDGFEYRAGERIGDEPRLSSQNLPGGDRIRGWVWYAIPEVATPTSLVLVAPGPRLRIRLDEPQ